MKILVTGANGLLGQKLSALLMEDESVFPILSARKNLNFSLRRGLAAALDTTDPVAVERVLSEFTPDVVINTAAMTMVDQCETDREICWLNNVTAVNNLINACRKTKTHLIHVSTDFIFDGSHGPLDENEKPNPVNYYGESKAEAERLLIASDVNWAILRTVLVYGVVNDLSRSNIVLWVKDSLEKGKQIKVVNDQWRTPTLAEDLAIGCYLAAKKRAKGIFHISGKDFMSPYDLAIAVAEVFNLDKSLIVPTDSNQFKQPARRPLKTGFIIEKARKELGFEPRSIYEGLKIVASQLSAASVTSH